jgi:hypothetical protein
MEHVSEEQFGSRRDCSVSMAAANLYSLAIILPPVALLGALYAWRWGGAAFLAMAGLRDISWGASLLALVGGVVVHELLHGLGWVWAARKPRAAIHFGFQLKTLTPYAHCREPMDVRAYRIGAAVPGVVLGLLPAAYGIVTGAPGVMAFGLLFTLAAGGDALILWLLRREAPGTLVADHPERAGCYVLDASPPTATEPEGTG